MKGQKFILFILLLMVAQVAPAQERVSVNVVYEFSHIRDLSQKDNPYVMNMVLSVGKTTSRYCTEKELREHVSKSEIKKQQQKIATSPGPMITVVGGPGVRVTKSGVVDREEIMKNFSEKKLQITGFVGPKKYRVETSLPKIDWTLQPEKKKIGGYTCQKATGHYAGRKYISWFAPELPFRDGPWKLNGLPGLILEARDTSDEVIFTFKSINRNEDPHQTVASIMSNSSSIETNLKRYKRGKKAFQEDPEAVMLAAFPDAHIYFMDIDDSGSGKPAKIKKYNPIEKKE